MNNKNNRATQSIGKRPKTGLIVNEIIHRQQ